MNNMLKGKLADVEIPKFGNNMACLSWLLRGWCCSTCIHANCHKQAGAAMVESTHKLMDMCSMPASN